MDYLDRIARSKEQVARDLEAFVTESAAGPALNDLPLNALTQFPEEQSGRAATAAMQPEDRRLHIPALLTAAVVAAAVSAAWWGGLFPRNGSTAIDVPARQSAQVPIAPPATADASGTPPAEIPQALEIQSSSRAPVATVRPSVALSEIGRDSTSPPNPVALSGNAAGQRLAADRSDSSQLGRAASSTRGTSGAERPTSIQRPAVVPPIEVPRTPPMVAENTAVRPPAFEPPVDAPAPSVPSPPVPAAAAARPAPAALPSVVARSEQSEIQRTLGQYRAAYGLLDADAARAVWPSVDVRALARAVDSLTSQQLAFESCQFNIAGEAATAECLGSATYTPKVGNRDPKLETRQWTFHLRKVDDAWKIQSAQTRR